MLPKTYRNLEKYKGGLGSVVLIESSSSDSMQEIEGKEKHRVYDGGCDFAIIVSMISSVISVKLSELYNLNGCNFLLIISQ